MQIKATKEAPYRDPNRHEVVNKDGSIMVTFYDAKGVIRGSHEYGPGSFEKMIEWDTAKAEIKKSIMDKFSPSDTNEDKMEILLNEWYYHYSRMRVIKGIAISNCLPDNWRLQAYDFDPEF